MKNFSAQPGGFSDEKRKLLELRLKQKGISSQEIPTIPRRIKTDPCPLSFAQQRLWFLNQLEPESTFYLILNAWRFQGPLNSQVLEQSLKELVRRHESLRTTFPTQSGQPVQMIHPATSLVLPVIDLQGLGQELRDTTVFRLTSQEAQHPCDLANGPLLRIHQLRLGAQEHALLITQHHIITDGWSNEILIRELTTVYSAFVSGHPSPLAPLPIQYADYAIWQRQWLQGAVLEEQLAYWKRQLADLPAVQIPTDFPRPLLQSHRGAQSSTFLSAELLAGLQNISQQEGVTLFIMLLASFQVLLMRYSGQSDISIGTPIANRHHARTENMIGFFVNTLVLRTPIVGNPTFQQTLQRVREVCLEAYAHQDVPFEQVVEAVETTRDLSRSPLFQIMFSLRNVPQEEEGLSDIQVRSQNTENVTSQFDLSLSVGEMRHGLHATMQYNPDLFETRTIERLLSYWQTLLTEIVQQPQTPIWNLPLLSPDQLAHLLPAPSAISGATLSPLSLSSRFEQQVEATPEAIALVCAEQHLTYHELNRRVNQLAHLLRALGVGPEIIVGIALERSPSLLIALLAIVKAGGAYLPLEPTAPSERMTALLQEAHVHLVLAMKDWQLPDDETTTIHLDVEAPRLVSQQEENLLLDELPGQLFSLISTSGSTGWPKGTGVTRQGFSHLLAWFLQSCELTPQSRVLVPTATSFDLTQKNLLAPLLAGGSVHLLPAGPYDPSLLCQTIAEQAITFVNCVPTMWYPLLDHDHARGFASFSSIRQIFTGGEALSIARLQQWLDSPLCQVQVLSAYGPTECTDIVTFMALGQPKRYLATTVPTGRPLPYSRLYILDTWGNLALPGSVGELYVGGEGVARGYAGRAGETATHFMPDSFSNVPGARLYRTGDLMRVRADETLEFVGRLDDQVKIRGVRIELGEIEAAVSAHPHVREQVVLACEDESGDKQLVAYVVAQPGTTLTGPQLRTFLQARLPVALLPVAFVFLDAFPLTPNGKIDRRKLPPPKENRSDLDSTQQKPGTQIEELMLGLWSEVLGRSQLGLHENFFLLGGHSLLATRLIARIAATLEVEIPVRTIFEEPTIAGFARRVEQIVQRHAGGIQIPPLVAGVRPENIPLSFAQQRLWFVDQLHSGSIAYLVPTTHYLPGTLNIAALESCIAETIRRHEILRTTFTMHKGQPVQIIHPAGRYSLPVIDLRGLAQEQRKHEGLNLIKQETGLPCNLEQGPLLRTTLLRLGNEEHVLQLTLHHIITDGWSNQVLIKEALTLYQAFALGYPMPLANLPIQYADYALWQRRWLQGEMLEAQLAYWTRQLGGVPPIELPTDYPRPAIASVHGASHAFTFTPELSQALITLSRQENITLFMMLLAAFQILFYRYTQQTDIVMGTDSANRNRIETEGIVGFFVNLLALRTDLSGKPTVRDVFKRVREVTLGAYTHQDTPFELLVERLAPDHYLDRIPLVQVLFVLQNIAIEVEQSSNAGQQIERQAVHPRLTTPTADSETEVKFDLALFMWERDGQLSGVLNYRLDLFKAPTIAAMTARFNALLQSIVKQPDAPIDLLSMWLDEENVQHEQHAQKHRRTLHFHDDGLFALPDGKLTNQK